MVGMYLHCRRASGNGTTSGTQIVDVDTITSGTTDPNLTNNTATAITTVGTGTQADLGVTNTSSSRTVAPGSNFTMTAVVTNYGPATASALVFSEPTASNAAGTPTVGTAAGTINATFVSLATPSGWTCTTHPRGRLAPSVARPARWPSAPRRHFRLS